MNITEPSVFEFSNEWNEKFNENMAKINNNNLISENTMDMITTTTQLCNNIQVCGKGDANLKALCLALKDKKTKKNIFKKLKKDKKPNKSKYRNKKRKSDKSIFDINQSLAKFLL